MLNLTSLLRDKNSKQHPVALAMFRLCLGIAQMWMAVASFILLIQKGVQKETLIMVGITTCLTLLSRAIFREHRNIEPTSHKPA
jgi:hypothetical protein